jgi:hypothetical protein
MREGWATMCLLFVEINKIESLSCRDHGTLQTRVFEVQGAWHSSNTLYTMVHGQTYRIIILAATPIERIPPFRHMRTR